jgi:hypothetical protein
MCRDGRSGRVYRRESGSWGDHDPLLPVALGRLDANGQVFAFDPLAGTGKARISFSPPVRS